MNVTVEYSDDGTVATWWLDRPEARNAVNLAMWEALCEAADAANQNADLRVVIIRGRGKHFSAGADIASLGRTLAADHDVPLPNVDLALAAMALATGMPPDAGRTIFTVARVAGWTAHYVEELDERPLRYRARAVYAAPGRTARSEEPG